jgi:hypothetical protein
MHSGEYLHACDVLNKVSLGNTSIDTVMSVCITDQCY